MNENYISLVEEIYIKLKKDHGIILLDHMSKEENKKILETSIMYPDIIAFNIGKAEEKRIVFRYKQKTDKYIDIKKLLKEGNEAYSLKKYDDCIKNYLEVLSFGFPKGFVYARLGLAFLKKNDKQIALNYLIVADYICKQEKDDYDFEELILKLKNELNYDTRIKEFNYDDITEELLKSNIDIITMCKKYSMSDEQINTLILMYARDFYTEGYYEKGDLLFKFVERSKNKTKSIIRFMEEIRKNKKFYINRSNEKTKQTVLKLQNKIIFK